MDFENWKMMNSTGLYLAQSYSAPRPAACCAHGPKGRDNLLGGRPAHGQCGSASPSWPSPGPSRPMPSGRRGARSARNHRTDGPCGGASGGNPSVDGRRWGLRMEHRRWGAEASGKVWGGGDSPYDGATARGGGENGGERWQRRRWGALDGDGCGSLHKELRVTAILPAAKKTRGSNGGGECSSWWDMSYTSNPIPIKWYIQWQHRPVD
jgi:hypothetical protein